MTNAEERGYLFLSGDAEGALLEVEYEGAVIPLEIGKCEAEYEFFLQEENILCRITLPLEGTIQGGEGTLLSPEKRKELEQIFGERIKLEVLHTIKIAERAKADLFGILPRMKQQEPSLSTDISDEALWRSLRFEVVPDLKLKDMGRKR